MVFDFAAFLAWFTGLIQAYGSLSVFIGVIIEEIIVPIPSPVVLVTAGAVLIPAGAEITEALSISFFTIAIPAAIAGTLGSFFVYGIGYFGGKPLIERMKKFLGVDWKDVEKMGERLGKGKKIWVSIVILRATPVFPISLISLVSGLLRLSWKKYAVATFIGSIPRAMTFALAGWALGSAYISIAESLGSAENLIFAGIIIMALIGFYYYKRRRRTNSKATK